MIRFSDIPRKDIVIPAIAGASMFVVGSGLGYILNKTIHRRIVKNLHEETSSQMTLDFDQDDTIEQCILRKVDSLSSDIKILINAFDFTVVSPTAEPETVVVKNIFTEENEDDQWWWDEEKASRSADYPYVIHVDEYNDGATEYKQMVLTYYKGDNVLCDEQDVPIYGYDKTVGELKFGHGSKDPKVVYVRNDKMHGEYEIVLHEGHYQVEVLGQEIEDQMLDEDVRHSVRRFKE